LKEATKWYHKAAEQGDADAQYWLGVMYDNGEGVTQDNGKALKRFQAAANQGDKFAWLHLPCTEVFHRIFVGKPEPEPTPGTVPDPPPVDGEQLPITLIPLPVTGMAEPASGVVPITAQVVASAPRANNAPSHINVVNEVCGEKRGREKIKIIRDNEIYWKLVAASYRGIESCFALTKDREIEPLFKLTSEVNADWKIILMPLDEKTSCPAPEQFEQMKDYFLDEGYFENLKVWTDRLNKESVRFTDDNLEDLLTKTNPQAMLAEIDK